MVLNDDEEDPNDAEETTTMVVIKERDNSSESNSDLSIFPPINHENLHRSFSPFSSSASTSSFSPSDSDRSDPGTPIAGEASSDWRWWIGIGLEALRLKALRLASAASLGGNAVVWWKASGIVATAVIWSLWARARYRRRLDDLSSAVKIKDERINQLLHQIAELNQVLIARHKTLLASKLSN